MTQQATSPASAIAAVDAAPDRGTRLRTWFEDAYQRPGTRAFMQVLDLTIMLVSLSLVLLLLEDVSYLQPYGGVFIVLEAALTVMFAIDYVAHIAAQEHKMRYIFSAWGIIDLLAILPFFFSLANLNGMRAGRALRALRALRVLKLLHQSTTASDSGVEVQPSLWRDFQFALIIVCSLLALWHVFSLPETDQLFWLVVGCGAAANVALREWCVRQERYALGTMLVYVAVFAGVVVSIMLDAEGDGGRATAIALLTIVFVLLTTTTLEGPAGVL